MSFTLFGLIYLPTVISRRNRYFGFKDYIFLFIFFSVESRGHWPTARGLSPFIKRDKLTAAINRNLIVFALEFSIIKFCFIKKCIVRYYDTTQFIEMILERIRFYKVVGEIKTLRLLTWELRGRVKKELTGYLKSEGHFTNRTRPLRLHSTSHCTLSSDFLYSMALHLC